MSFDSIGKRMKENYEQRSKTSLIRRMPVAIRLDGKAFHTFTRGLKKPFDDVLIKAMQETTKALCENIQGCVFGYTQSDEITLILQDYKTLETEAWFDYEVQKMVSISASMCTYYFNKFFKHYSEEYVVAVNDLDYNKILLLKQSTPALFDSRVFNIPKEEVTNMIYWRQIDATRNSIQMVGQANFSQKELQGKSCNMIQEMLLTEKNINWNDLPAYKKRGSAVIKDENSKWVIDLNMPQLINEDRHYIEKLINIKEEL
jgi:tRNA(His) guanylyltransferase